MTHDSQTYVGSELDTFKHARNWKRYWSDRVEPYLTGRVLEVGAGIGVNTEFLLGPSVRAIVRLEPDRALVARMVAPSSSPAPKGQIEIDNRCGTVATLDQGDRFDTILYLDVLEHIEDDRGELERAAAHLSPGGHLAVLAPAFQFLYSPFDRAIGHYRRYTASTLSAVAPARLVQVAREYMDGPGALLSMGNRALLRHASPTIAQIKFWDSTIIPLATVTDRMTKRWFGRSVLCVWRSQP
jgi:2-polyprenyl-3-methyl-5-hydroxy-6-metoxy-1,4-benzoquinol methylase